MALRTWAVTLRSLNLLQSINSLTPDIGTVLTSVRAIVLSSMVYSLGMVLPQHRGQWLQRFGLTLRRILLTLLSTKGFHCPPIKIYFWISVASKFSTSHETINHRDNQLRKQECSRHGIVCDSTLVLETTNRTTTPKFVLNTRLTTAAYACVDESQNPQGVFINLVESVQRLAYLHSSRPLTPSNHGVNHLVKIRPTPTYSNTTSGTEYWIWLW